MLLTLILLLAICVTIIPSLRQKWYGLHAISAIAIGWLAEYHFAIIQTEVFSQHALTLAIIVHIFMINIVLFIMYGVDKRASKRGGWRIPERVLHGFTIVGGTPAAFIAQKIFRHKTRKKSFRNSFFGVVIFQITALIMLYIITDIINYQFL